MFVLKQWKSISSQAAHLLRAKNLVASYTGDRNTYPYNH